MVSLSDSEYNDIFNAVIQSAANSIDKANFGHENVNSDINSHLEKENTKSHEGHQNSPDIESLQQKCHSKENDNPLKKKSVPKFNVPVKVLKNNLKSNEIKCKKFTPPNPHIDSLNNKLPTLKTSSGTKKILKEKNCSVKSQPVLPINVVQGNEKFKEALPTQDQNNKSTFTKQGKERDQLPDIMYKDADSTEYTPAVNKYKTIKPKNIEQKKCSAPRKLNVIDKTMSNKQSQEFCHEFTESDDNLKENIDHSDSETFHNSHELSQSSNGMLLISENPHTQLSQPSPELNQRQRLEWLRKRRDVGVWVQCCKIHCSKWRYLEHIKDPLDIPEYWVCQMNNDSRYNSCEKPEKGPKLNEQVDLINNKYTAGSVVWAHMDGFPWWPALVDDDPDVEAYYWLNGFSDIPTYYHVVFFDEQEVSRAWVTPNNMHPFTGKEKEKKFNVKYFRGINYSSRITAAKEQAKLAIALNLKDRLEQYGFIARYRGPIGEKKTFKGKHQRKVSSDSESDTFDDTDYDDTSFKRKKIQERNKSKKRRKNVNENNSNSMKLCHENREMKKNKKIMSLHSSHNRKDASKEPKSKERGSHSRNKNNKVGREEITELCSEREDISIMKANCSEYSNIMDEEMPDCQKENNNIFDLEETSGDNDTSIDKKTCDDKCEDNDISERSPKDCEDVDPFLETEESDRTNAGSNIECSNLATIGTDLAKWNKDKTYNFKNDSMKLSSKKQTCNEVERQEADTSDNITESLLQADSSRDVANVVSSDESIQSESILLTQMHISDNLPDSKDAVVPEISLGKDDEYESDPFEMDY